MCATLSAARAALVPLVALAAVAAGCGGDGDTDATTTAPRRTSTTTTVAPGPSDPDAGSIPASQAQPESAMWPFADTSRRFSDPVPAALTFATDYLGFRQPVVGQFQAGDSRSGEVSIRPTLDGPVTTVLVRQLGDDDSWWVIGAVTPNLQLNRPQVGDRITSPVALAGTSTAFEGTVDVAVRQDGSTEPIGTGFVTGGSMGQLGPFTGQVAFAAPTAAGGSVVLSTTSAEDGRVQEAAALRVAFGG